MTATSRARSALLPAFAILIVLTLFTPATLSTATVSSLSERGITEKHTPQLPPGRGLALEARHGKLNPSGASAIQALALAQQAYLKASNTDLGDFFGYSVAVSGDTAVVGAYAEASNSTGVNGDQSDDSQLESGAVYVFVRSGGTWTQQAYLKASNNDGPFGPNVGDRFGHTVAISGDTIVVGAPFEDSNATGVNGDQGNNLAQDSGAVYVFVRSGGIWSQQAYLKASNNGNGFVNNDSFGSTVSISGDTVVVGAPGEDSDARGVNGNQGNNSRSESGAAYVFVRTGGTWSQQAYLKASNADAHDLFGRSVAISGDSIVVGARNESSNATGVNGDQENNSANASGAAYVFVRSGAVWSQQAYLKASNTGPADFFGESVAISGDTVVVGAADEDSNATGVDGNQSDNSADAAGAAYVFERTAGAWNQQAYLKASNMEAGDAFGGQVAVSGNMVVVGSQFEDSSATGVGGNQNNNSASQSGAAYLFANSGGTWSQQAYLKASNTDTLRSDLFGGSVAISGDTVIAGAAFEGSNATGVNGDQSDNSARASGAVYVYAPIVKAAQSISFSPIGNKTYGDAPFALSATASSGLPISFAVVSGPATLAGNTLTMTGVGIVTVRASQNGDANYEAAADVTQSFTVQAGQPVLLRNNVLTLSPAGSATITSSHLQVVAAGIPASQIVYTLVSPLPAKGQVKLNGTLVGWLLNPATGHYYTSTAPGHRGATASEAASYGAFLTTINNAAENIWITNNFSRALNAYNGLNDPGGWDNGESSAFRNWYPGEPNSGQETAVHMYLNLPDADGAQWNDIDPNERVHPGIVEKNDSNGILLSFTQEDIDQGRVTYHHFGRSDISTPTDPDDFTFTVSDGAGGTISNTIFQINVDSTGPTADIVDVTPDPRADSVAAITISFSEAVNAFDLQDLQLRRDGGSNLLTIAQSLTTSDNITWTLGNLSALTAAAGSYTLTLTATGSGITDVFGNVLAGDSSDTWVVPSPTPQTITFGALANKIFGDAPFTLNATASSGLPVSFSIVSGPATIFGNTLTITGIGTVVVRASQEGNENYSAAIPVEQSFRVDDRTAPVPNVGSLPTITGECSASITSPPTATDDSAGQITGTTTDPTSYNSQGTFIVHWTYDDGHGNSSTQTQTVIIQDVTAPAPNLATLPTVIGECSASIPSPPTATDNCGGQITGTTTDPVSYTTPGTFVVHWNYNDQNGNVSTQTQTVTVQEASISVDAGPDQVFCNTASVTMVGNTPAAGVGTWTLVTGSGTIAEPNNPTTVISDLGFGANVFRWTISNGSCGASSDDVVITRNSCPSVLTLFSNGDSFLKASGDNANEGANERLRLQSAGNNRATVMFDLTGISTVGLQSATLILTVAETSNNWGASGRLVDAHRLLVEWTEGNGRNDVMVGGGPGFRGSGEGITWNCAKDLNIANQSANCNPQWNGGSSAASTAPGALHTNGLFGEVFWDVTADVLAGANFGWLIRKQNEGQNGQVRYYSREGALLAGNPNLAPRLVLVYSP
ncbi:MAG TPA: cadherin-like domain-containing protein [Pyrinomonadaceae bacterium]